MYVGHAKETWFGHLPEAICIILLTLALPRTNSISQLNALYYSTSSSRWNKPSREYK